MPDLDEILRAIVRRNGGFGSRILAVDVFDSAGLHREGVDDDRLSDHDQLLVHRYLFGEPFAWVKDAMLAELLIDVAFNYGAGVAIRLLCRALGLAETDKMGDTIRSATAVAAADTLALRLIAEVLWHYAKELEAEGAGESVWRLRRLSQLILAACKLNRAKGGAVNERLK